jgi:hypothetical protein
MAERVLEKVDKNEKKKALDYAFKLKETEGYSITDFDQPHCFVVKFSDGSFTGFFLHKDGTRSVLDFSFDFKEEVKGCASIW